MDALIRFISTIFKNIFKLFGGIIIFGLIFYFIYFLIGFFSLPSDKVKTYSLDTTVGKLEVKTSFRTFDGNYHDSIIDRKGNIYAQVLFSPKTPPSAGDTTDILLIFKDKDGFEIFRTSIPIGKISTMSNNNDFNGKLTKDVDTWDKEIFSFELYNKINSIEFYVMTWMEIPKPRN